MLTKTTADRRLSQWPSAAVWLSGVLVSITFFAAGTGVMAENIFANADFETVGKNGWPVGWRPSVMCNAPIDPEKVTFSVDDKVRRDGSLDIG